MIFNNLFMLALIFVDNMYTSGSYQYPINIQLRLMRRFHSLPVIRTMPKCSTYNYIYDEYVHKKYKGLGNYTNKSYDI